MQSSLNHYVALLYGKLREGQDGAILPARDCPFCSRNSISPKSKRVHERFLSQNIFRDSKRIFCNFPVGETRKPRRAITFAYIWLPFQWSKINNYKDHFSVFFMPYNKSPIDQASSVKMAGCWPRSLFAFLWTSTSSRSIKTQKENLANIQPSWPRAWSIMRMYWTCMEREDRKAGRDSYSDAFT